MSVIEGTEIPIEIFNGLVTNIDSRALPPGVSPDCADNAFKPGIPGTVQTRPGLTAIHQFTAPLTYMATYIDQDENNRNLYVDQNGLFFEEFPFGTFTQYGVFITPGAYAKSDTAFGSEFIGFSDGKFGLNNPRRWIGVGASATGDRVSQIGPAQAPNVMETSGGIAVASGSQEGSANVTLAFEYVPNFSLLVIATPLTTGLGCLMDVAGVGADYDGSQHWFSNSAATPTGNIYFNNPINPTPTLGAGGTVASSYITLVTVTPHGLTAGQMAVIAGVGAGWDGTFQVAAVIDPFTFTYFGSATGLGAVGAGGTIVLAGNIPAGVHQLSVIFITRNGYFTAPAPPSSWTATGGKSATATNIPIGPSNVIARLLIATAAAGANFFFSQSNQTGITSFLIPDNTTTSWTFDFTDLALNSSQSADLLFDRIELPEVAGMIQFGDRVMAWGGRNHIENFLGMSSFAGGVLTPGGYPLGWQVDGTFGTGGATTDFDCGFEYVINNAGAGPRGMITQGAFQDYLGVAILSPNTQYSARVILAWTGALAGNFTLDLYSPSTTTVLATAVKDMSTLTGTHTEYIIQFDNKTPAVIPSDTILRLYADFTGTSAQSLLVDTSQMFPTYDPFLPSVLFASNVADPEAFQGTTGFLNINENDGRRLVSCFIIRDRLYMLKNIGGLFTTSDDPNNEPSSWTVDTISRRVGAETINCVGTHVGDTGEDWVFIITREGLYIFWSSEPPKISQEIQPTWEQINKNYMYKMWIVVDTSRRRVLIGAPMGEVTSPNKIIQMDYQAVGATAESVASGPPVTANYQGQIKAHMVARKWSPWNITALSGGQLEQADGNAEVMIGGTKLYELDESALTDDGVPIPGGGYYVTAFYPSDEQAQSLQIKGNQVFLRYMTISVNGIGDFEIESFGPEFVDSYLTPIAGAPALTMAMPAPKDIQTFIEFSAPVIANKFTASDPTSPWWSLTNVEMYIGQDPVSVLREVN